MWRRPKQHISDGNIVSITLNVLGDEQLLNCITQYQVGIPQALVPIYKSCRTKANSKGMPYTTQLRMPAAFRCFVLFKLIYDVKFDLVQTFIRCQLDFVWFGHGYGD